MKIRLSYVRIERVPKQPPPGCRLVVTAAQKRRAGKRRLGDLFWTGAKWHPVWNFGRPMTAKDVYARPVGRRKVEK